MFTCSTRKEPAINITVYSTGPTCIRCRLSIDILTRAGVVFEVVDITTDDRARDYVMHQLSHTQAPVIVATTGQDQPGQDQHWSGFRPDRLHALTQTDARGQNANLEPVNPS